MALPGWKYKKAITIDNSNNPNTLTDYQILVENPIYNETGLVGSWHFNEGSGTTAYDSSGNNNHGTLYNSPTWTTGKFGSGLSFDGTDDYVRIATLNGAPKSYMTITAWVKTTYIPESLCYICQINRNASGVNNEFIFQMNSDGTLTFWDYSTTYGFSQGQKTNGTINNGVWRHIAFVKNGTSGRYYIDGQPDASPTASVDVQYGSSDFVIGGNYRDNNLFFNGQIDEVRIYNRALSSDEIQALYNAKARPDYGDVRFTDANGSTQLSYWQEKDGKFWVKVPSITASSTKTIYLYYGNPSTTSQSSIANTFIREIDGGKPLIASWSFEEGAGTTTADSSGNNNNGTLVNGPTWTTAGKFNKALSFDGTNDYVNTNLDISWNNTNEISFSVWIKPNNVSVLGAILGKIYPDWEWVFYHEGAVLKLVYWNTSGGNTNGMDIVTGSVLSAGTWTHVVYTWDKATSRFYVNGSLVASKTATDPSINQNRTNSMLIGGHIYAFADSYFNGVIDQVQFFNRTLTSAEITDLYNNYGYSTTAYPGRVLVRKFSSPEPTTSVGAEMKNILLGASFLFNLV